MKDFSHVKSASQFLRELKAMYPDAKWDVQCGCIRQGTSCPIAFAANKINHLWYENYQYRLAAAAIGLNPKFAKSIVAAADGLWGHVRRVMLKELVGQ